MSEFGPEVGVRLREALEPLRDEANAAAMARYMRGQFPFLGIPTPTRRTAARRALAGIAPGSEGDVVDAALGLWSMDEREYQYCGAELVAKWAGICGPDFVLTLARMVTTKSWWDTVDALAVKVAGPLVIAYPELAGVMDEWAAGEEMWLQRTAILHQLAYKERTDADRLARYCLLRAGERDFFIRKAIGWALREYSKTDAEWVRVFVARHEAILSPLSKREALVWLERRASAAQAMRPVM